MGFIDAFVYAHKYHCHSADKPGKFEDCMEGKICLMTAITPANDTYQAICLARRPIDIPCQRFRLPSAKARYPNLSNIRSATRSKGDGYKGRAVFTDGGTHTIDGETTAGWVAIARFPNRRLYIMFGPVITTEARSETAYQQHGGTLQHF